MILRYKNIIKNMQYLVKDQEQYIIEEFINENQLNEGFFWSWLLKSRKFGDLWSLKKAVSVGKAVSGLKFEVDKAVNNVAGDKRSSDTEVEENLLKAKLDAAEKAEAEFKKKHEDSEFLLKVVDLTKSSEEAANSKKLIGLLTDKKAKQVYQDQADLAQKESDNIQGQLKLAVDKGGGKFENIKDYKAKKEKEKLDRELQDINTQRLRLQNKQIAANINKTNVKTDKASLDKSIETEDHSSDIY